jgi:putative heme-binding domain-containing protein
LEPHPEIINWAQDLAKALLKARQQSANPEWVDLPHPSHPESPSPWTTQNRRCRDGRDVPVISSLQMGAPNAEQRTGILRSKKFTTTNELSFWIVGHRGNPNQEAQRKNYITLIDDEGNELFRADPPRNDIARKVTWTTEAGKKRRLQITDGDAGDAYAWLGMTRISGVEGLSTDTFAGNTNLDAQLTTLAEILKFNAPVNLRDQLKPWLSKDSQTTVPQVLDGPKSGQFEQLINQRILQYQAAKKLETLDPQKGAHIFQINCATCHQIKHQGGLIGPQLDGIGSRGIQRLTEDILDPNRNVDSHFHLTQFTFNDGTTSSAFITSERGNALQIRDLEGKFKRLQKAKIASRLTLPISLMPATFGKALTSKDFVNLIEWLRTQS